MAQPTVVSGEVTVRDSLRNDSPQPRVRCHLSNNSALVEVLSRRKVRPSVIVESW